MGPGFYRAGTFVLVGGAAASVLAALTGFWDWLKSTEKGTQARRTVNAHGWTMVAVTALVLVAIALRLFAYDGDSHTGAVALALSLVIAALTAVGAPSEGRWPTTTASTSRRPATSLVLSEHDSEARR